MTAFADRAKDTTQTTGTGAVTLDGVAPLGFNSFFNSFFTSGGLEIFYCIVDSATGAFEVGRGSYDRDTDVLTRVTVYTSSNANALVDFAAGEKEVFCTVPAFIMEAGRITVDDTDPAAFNNESQGYQPNRSLWFNWSTGVIWAYDGDVSDNNGVWEAFPGFTRRQDSAFAGVALGGFTNVDLLGQGRFASSTYTSQSGSKGRAHADYSHVFGHGWPAGETGYGAHQSEVQGLNGLTADATPTELTGRLYLQSAGAGLFRVHIVAYSDGGDYKAWAGDVLVYRGAGAVPTIDTSTLAEVGASAGAASWAAVLAAGSTTGADGIKATVTGAAATNIHWTVAAFATVAHNSAHT